MRRIRSRGVGPASRITRAHVLAAIDDGLPVSIVAAVLGIARTTVWRTVRDFRQRGLEAVLSRNTGRPRVFPLHVSQWVCAYAERLARDGSSASLSRLRDAAKRRWRLDSLSRETVRRWLSNAKVVAKYESPQPAGRKLRAPV